jgi:hypothetical protein
MFGESCQLVEVMDLNKKGTGFIDIQEKDGKQDRNFQFVNSLPLDFG